MSCVLDYPRDSLRYEYFVRDSNQHQAKMELRTFKWIVERYTKVGDTILDPMSGVGTVHFANYMGRHTIAIELVPEFIELQHRNIKNMTELWEAGMFYGEFDTWDFEPTMLKGQPTILEGDCRRFLPLVPEYFGNPSLIPTIDAVVLSPPYGNLWAFSESNRESKIAKEKNYVVGYDDSDANVGNYPNYIHYLTAMKIIYGKCYETLRPGGVLVTVVKDYIHQGKRLLCSKDNLRLCLEVGFIPEDWHFRAAGMTTSPYAMANRAKRIEAGKHREELDIKFEDILVLRKV